MKEKNYIDNETVEKSINFFYPFFNSEETGVNFYGGEPLLAFDQIEHAVMFLEEKNKNKAKDIKYSMTINGSLLNDDICRFLDRHNFSLLLSFDGLAHDTGRQQGTFDDMVDIIQDMREYPGIDFNTNSVFPPRTVGELSKSIQFIMSLGIKAPRMALSTVEEWDDEALARLKEQLTDLKNFLVSFYRETGTVPVKDFKIKESKGMFGCFAAQDRMSISPDGKVWGCFLFHDFFKDKTDTREYQKYFLGELDDFIENHETIMAEQLPNYKKLYQANFFTEKNLCCSCKEVKSCKVCPVNAAMAGSIVLGKIPSWRCKINNLMKEIRAEFHREIEDI
jgi:sulfatase maturation enzyme AslB (radical SAM superfamily)